MTKDPLTGETPREAAERRGREYAERADPMNLKILVRTHGEDNEWFAFISLTPAMQRCIMARRKNFGAQQASDRDLHETVYWDATPLYLDATNILDEALLDRARGAEAYVRVNTDLPMQSQRTEVDRLHIGADHFYWSCTPKHTDLTVETELIPYSLLSD